MKNSANGPHCLIKFSWFNSPNRKGAESPDSLQEAEKVRAQELGDDLT